jgi:glycosidase
MRALPLYPCLYQINTRVWLTELGQKLGRAATLDDLPDAALDAIAAQGFDWVWFLSVWQTGLPSQRVSRHNPAWRRDFEETLEDLCDDDIMGSGFAITGYTAHEALGGEAALARLRERLRTRGLRLLLDLVPNHTGLGHPWLETHPDYFVSGTADDLAREPQNYTRVECTGESLVLAHGRDPYFSGWADTLQLDYSNPRLQDAMRAELLEIARQCDGVRCDMAMLLLPDVFERTWGRRPAPFWRTAIEGVRAQVPDFCFMAEVYWDLEWTLQQEGFDYTYDKRLYDRLSEGHPQAVREHLHAELDYQRKLVRFLENHDEPRAAAAFRPDVHRAAATITYLSPGMRFFHEGQLEGRTKRISPHLCRAPREPRDAEISAFYERLLHVLKRSLVRDGQWQLLECAPAWEGNASSESFVAFMWRGLDGARLLAAVNFANSDAQCYVRLPFSDFADAAWRLEDVIGDVRYERDGTELRTRGLYLDVPPWKAHVFTLTKR